MQIAFSKQELRTTIQHQRNDLIQIISKLSEDQLAQQSLCSEWSMSNVLGHIIGFEISKLDLIKLLLSIKKLDDITADQAKRYDGLDTETYVKLLQKGVKRITRVINFTPEFLLNVKFIPVPFGKLCIGQLFSDIVLDRAIHQLDITQPLKLGSDIKDEAVLRVCLKFILQSLNLLESKIPHEYYGKVVRLQIEGRLGGSYDWEIGKGYNESGSLNTEPLPTVHTDLSDFIFTITGRAALIKKSVSTSGNAQFEELIRTSLDSNALWDKQS